MNQPQCGERVQAMYHGPHGTTLSHGHIVSVHTTPRRPGWEVVVSFPSGASENYYLDRYGENPHGYLIRLAHVRVGVDHTRNH